MHWAAHYARAWNALQIMYFDGALARRIRDSGFGIRDSGACGIGGRLPSDRQALAAFCLVRAVARTAFGAEGPTGDALTASSGRTRRSEKREGRQRRPAAVALPHMGGARS